MEQHDELRSREEVLKDFRMSLEKIDLAGEYNPFASDFDKALRIGLMWHLLCELDGDEKNVGTESVGTDDEIAEEIHGAKKYFQKYMDTKDSVFKNMASDELHHATVLLKKANARLPTGEDKNVLKSHESEIVALKQQIESL